MARKLTFQKWKAQPHCATCGVPWIEHPGLAPTCLVLQTTRLERLQLTAENRRLKELLAGAMAFRLLVYLSVLPAAAPHTVKNLLRELAKIRRTKRGDKQPIHRKPK